MDQRKLMDNASSIGDMAKVRMHAGYFFKIIVTDTTMIIIGLVMIIIMS